MWYTHLVRPILFRSEPEAAHDFAIRASTIAARIPGLCEIVRAVVRPKPKPVKLLGLTFPNPVGLAGGMDKNAAAPLAWWAMGFGFVELGTVTPLPQEGNVGPRMFRLPTENALINRMGFNNAGAVAVAARLKHQTEAGQRPRFPIGVSLGKNKLTPDDRTAADYAACAHLLGPHADFLSINVSSPNTPGLRALQTPQWLSKLVTVVLEAGPAKPTLVKVAPELDGDELRAAADAVMAAGAAGVIATNTLACTAPTGEPAGKSGAPLRDIALQRVSLLRKHLGDAAAIIGVGGVACADSAQRMLDAGADLVQVYTALVYEGPFLPVAITRRLRS